MTLNLRGVRLKDGERAEFDYTLGVPGAGTARVSGAAFSRAGVVTLEGELSGEFEYVCDRCLAPFKRAERVTVNAAVVRALANAEEPDGFIVCPGDELDLDAAFTEEFILSLPMKNLCGENCENAYIKIEE